MQPFRSFRSSILLSLFLPGDILKVSAFCTRLSPATIGGCGGVGVARRTLLLHSSSTHHEESSYLVAGPDQEKLSNARRSLILQSSLLWLVVAPRASVADDDDLTENEDELTTALVDTLYNPDGSLKANVSAEATFRTVSFRLATTGEEVEAIDGKPKQNTSSITDGKEIIVSYQLPDKWTDQPLYTENGKSVCRKISVYKANHSANLNQATKIGVPKALETYRIGLDDRADLMSGGTRDGYYDFDLAVAPKFCENSNENLGLGFCPYDEIFLLSATTIGDQLYVFCIEATKDQWKRANADIRRVRRSFRVDVATS